MNILVSGFARSDLLIAVAALFVVARRSKAYLSIYDSLSWNSLESIIILDEVSRCTDATGSVLLTRN